MKLLDKLVHMDSLTHLRNISFSKAGDADGAAVREDEVAENKDDKFISSSVDLIIYKGL